MAFRDDAPLLVDLALEVVRRRTIGRQRRIRTAEMVWWTSAISPLRRRPRPPAAAISPPVLRSAGEQQQAPPERRPATAGLAKSRAIDEAGRRQPPAAPALRVRQKRHTPRASTAAARPMASIQPRRHPHPEHNRSTASHDDGDGKLAVACRRDCVTGLSIPNAMLIKCRSADTKTTPLAARNTPSDHPGAGADRGPQQLIFAHEDRERRDADQRQEADQQRHAPQPVGPQRAGERVPSRGCRSAGRAGRPRRRPAICRREWLSVWNSAAKLPSGPSP